MQNLHLPLAVGIGMPELIIILVILLFLFGASKLPALARGLGQSMKEFKKAAREDEEKPAEAKKPADVGKPGAN